METIGDARRFLSAAREVALAKPIIVIKAGRTAAAAKAAASHTGSLTGSDEVLDAAFRRSGVLRVNTIAETIGAILGKPVERRHLPPRAGDIRDSWADVSKAERILGYTPSVGLADGLRRTIEFLRG